ncbi:MAG: hypothetical protein ACP5HT_05070, partial [Conexivisphaera sp.]
PRGARGKPDISIMVESSSGDRRTAVLDCKFSYRQGYLTSGRFNVMAYMYKYGRTTACWFSLGY